LLASAGFRREYAEQAAQAAAACQFQQGLVRRHQKVGAGVTGQFEEFLVVAVLAARQAAATRRAVPAWWRATAS
jgi:hypothetical protein